MGLDCWNFERFHAVFRFLRARLLIFGPTIWNSKLCPKPGSRFTSWGQLLLGYLQARNSSKSGQDHPSISMPSAPRNLEYVTILERSSRSASILGRSGVFRLPRQQEGVQIWFSTRFSCMVEQADLHIIRTTLCAQRCMGFQKHGLQI